ncbi:hypothetical protein [Flavivirga algicola]|uniref:Lipoprotein n=1 Tax=Flavivirga algicola TaxID=2729136 RepID=A0ABX1RVS5_9FLAO|nr:hypothetical protein [Flavivirga algicola]NMH87656.1 hypothetical protein [Flavivirga algicola]
MKKNTTIFKLLIVILSLISCSSTENPLKERECGTHNGNKLYTGPKGGCYYYNSNDNKTYVDRAECDC